MAQLECGVAQLIVCRLAVRQLAMRQIAVHQLAVRQARVGISAQHLMEASLAERRSDEDTRRQASANDEG